MGTFGPRGTLKALVVLTALVFAAPTSARAEDCGADYLVCLADAGDLGSSDSLHETDCYGRYIECVGRLILTY